MKLISTKQAALVLNVAPYTMRASRVTGTLLGRPAPNFIKRGHRVDYDEEVILAWNAQFSPCRSTSEYDDAEKRKSAKAGVA